LSLPSTATPTRSRISSRRRTQAGPHPEQPPLISDEDAKTELLRDIETWRDEEELSFDEVNAKFGAHFGEGFVVDSYRLASATQLREFALVLGVIDDPVITEAGTEQGDEPGEDGDLVDCEILGDGSDVPPASSATVRRDDRRRADHTDRRTDRAAHPRQPAVAAEDERQQGRRRARPVDLRVAVLALPPDARRDPAEIENDQHRRGHYLEPAIVAWFADQHPDWTIRGGGCWQHRDHDWYTASPDRLVTTAHRRHRGRRGQERRRQRRVGRGRQRRDPRRLPRAGRLRDGRRRRTTRAHRGAAALPRVPRVRRRVRPDEAAFIREQAAAFMARVRNGDRPDIDSHDQTYEAVRRLHPDIDRVDVELDPEPR
jgi:hypothetical protein